MSEHHSNLDELQAAYKAAVENWISAIRKEEALALQLSFFEVGTLSGGLVSSAPE